MSELIRSLWENFPFTENHKQNIANQEQHCYLKSHFCCYYCSNTTIVAMVCVSVVTDLVYAVGIFHIQTIHIFISSYQKLCASTFNIIFRILCTRDESAVDDEWWHISYLKTKRSPFLSITSMSFLLLIVDDDLKLFQFQIVFDSIHKFGRTLYRSR